MGFLHEPQEDHVAHTPLSAPFVVKPSLLDAVMFLAETAAPSALHMSLATQRVAGSTQSNDSTWNTGMNTTQPFHEAQKLKPKLGRQWASYLYHAAGLLTVEEMVKILSQFNWSGATRACVVEVRIHA